MSASPEFAEYVMELLQPLDALQGTRLFGGIGIKSGATQFAMIMGNTLYFVVDDATRAKYEGRDRKPFSYTTKKRRVFVKRYYEVPEDLLEDQDALIEWARESINVARKTTKKR